jgi:hypothetical protein
MGKIAKKTSFLYKEKEEILEFKYFVLFLFLN